MNAKPNVAFLTIDLVSFRDDNLRFLTFNLVLSTYAEYLIYLGQATRLFVPCSSEYTTH
jgi:hypothetical protein